MELESWLHFLICYFRIDVSKLNFGVLFFFVSFSPFFGFFESID